MDDSSDDDVVKPTFKITDGSKGKSDRSGWEQNNGQVKVAAGVDKSSTFHVPVSTMMPDANLTRPLQPLDCPQENGGDSD